MKYLLDTNAVIYLLEGTWTYPDFQEGDELLLSTISSIELLCGAKTTNEEHMIRNFQKQITIIPVNDEIAEAAAQIRKTTGLKVPDAVIAATAITENAIILSADKEMAKKLKTIRIDDPTT